MVVIIAMSVLRVTLLIEDNDNGGVVLLTSLINWLELAVCLLYTSDAADE